MFSLAYRLQNPRIIIPRVAGGLDGANASVRFGQKSFPASKASPSHYDCGCVDLTGVRISSNLRVATQSFSGTFILVMQDRRKRSKQMRCQNSSLIP